MKIALENHIPHSDLHIPAYCGGLGLLAGETLRAAADLALPMVRMRFSTARDPAHRRCDLESSLGIEDLLRCGSRVAERSGHESLDGISMRVPE
jgi:hypothetical protein